VQDKFENNKSMAIKHSDGLPEKQIYRSFIHQKLVAHKKKTQKNKLK